MLPGNAGEQRWHFDFACVPELAAFGLAPLPAAATAKTNIDTNINLSRKVPPFSRCP
jgi:hypothetical protein